MCREEVGNLMVNVSWLFWTLASWCTSLPLHKEHPAEIRQRKCVGIKETFIPKPLLFRTHLVSSCVILDQKYTPSDTLKACILCGQLGLENTVTPLPSGQLFLKPDLSVAPLYLMTLSPQHFRDKPEYMEKRGDYYVAGLGGTLLQNVFFNTNLS